MLDQATTELIEKIHESRLFGIFVEMGCGNPVAHELCKVPGASNTIYYSENAYDKDFSKEKYNLKGRWVSKDTILSISQILDEFIKTSIESGPTVSNSKAKVNLQYISTFQIGNHNDVSTHGFIGVKRKYSDLPSIYHVSIHETLSRQEYIDKIADIGLKLLSRDPEIGLYYDVDCVDYVYKPGSPNPINDTISFIAKSKYHNFAYIKANSEILRLEDLLRSKNKNLIIYKGSFNPIHNGHISIANKIKSLYTDSILCFSISTNTYDKGCLDFRDVSKRINIINKLGYDVLIYNRPLFSDILKILSIKSDKKIIFPIGYDTYQRITDIENIEAEFCVFGRNGGTCKNTENVKFLDMNTNISSSEIRDNILNGINISNAIPATILEDVINKFKTHH